MHSNGPLLVVIGVLCLIVAGVWYLYHNPHILGNWATNLRRTQRHVEDFRQEVRTEGLQEAIQPEPTPLQEEMAFDLSAARLNDEFHFDLNGDYSRVNGVKLVVRLTGNLIALIPPQAQGGRYQEKGEVYEVIIAEDLGGEDYVLIQHSAGLIVLTQDEPLTDGLKQQFKEVGLAYSQAGQTGNAHSINHKGVTLTFMDVGYHRFDSEDGRSDIRGRMYLPEADGLPGVVKFGLFQGDDGYHYFIEQLSQAQSLLWRGHVLNDQNGYIFSA